MKGFKIIRNIFFVLNLSSCLFLLTAVVRFPSVLGIVISESFGLTIHIAVMAGIFLSVFMVAVFHQLYEQAKMERW